MQVVNFRFVPEVSRERRAAVLEAVQAWSLVEKAALLKPEAKNPLVQRMAYAYVQDLAAAEQTIKRLTDMPEIESASLPAERRLMRTNGS